MMDTMMTRCVKDPFKRPHFVDHFSVDPELIDQINLQMYIEEPRGNDKRKRKVEHPGTVGLQSTLAHRRGKVLFFGFINVSSSSFGRHINDENVDKGMKNENNVHIPQRSDGHYA
jgi:hypothetical protein